MSSPEKSPNHNPGPETAPENKITFVATVPASARRTIEALFFFNPRQPDSVPGIHETIERLGVPQIVEAEEKLWLEVSSGVTQCLFACDTQAANRPVAVMLYCRPDPETLWVSHIAVDPVYGVHNTPDRPSVGILLLNQALEIARRIRGIRRLQLPYRKGSYLPVDPPESPPARPGTQDGVP